MYRFWVLIFIPGLDLWGDGCRMKPLSPTQLFPVARGREKQGVETGSTVCSDLVNVGTYDVFTFVTVAERLITRARPPHVYVWMGFRLGPSFTPFFLSRAPRH